MERESVFEEDGRPSFYTVYASPKALKEVALMALVIRGR